MTPPMLGNLPFMSLPMLGKVGSVLLYKQKIFFLCVVKIFLMYKKKVFFLY